MYNVMYLSLLEHSLALYGIDLNWLKTDEEDVFNETDYPRSTRSANTSIKPFGQCMADKELKSVFYFIYFYLWSKEKLEKTHVTLAIL